MAYSVFESSSDEDASNKPEKGNERVIRRLSSRRQMKSSSRPKKRTKIAISDDDTIGLDSDNPITLTSSDDEFQILEKRKSRRLTRRETRESEELKSEELKSEELESEELESEEIESEEIESEESEKSEEESEEENSKQNSYESSVDVDSYKELTHSYSDEYLTDASNYSSSFSNTRRTKLTTHSRKTKRLRNRRSKSQDQDLDRKQDQRKKQKKEAKLEREDNLEETTYSNKSRKSKRQLQRILDSQQDKNSDKESDETKFNRLEQLLERSKQFSEIIANNLLESSLSKRQKNGGKKELQLREQPKLLSGVRMWDYQLEGLDWLVTLYENGLNGILADEMGLGKTIQSIALLAFLYEHGNKGPFLVVCPLSTVGNWANEIKKFAPKIPFVTYVGSKQEREQLRKSKVRSNKQGIIITSFELVIKDFTFLSRFKWKFLVVDEGHRLKNLNSKLIIKLRALDTGNRLLLTGTPLQNNLDELWSLLNFILPDIFSDIDLFHSWFDFSEFNNSGNELINSEIQRSVVENLHTILKPFLLRRLKSVAVKTMPPKREYIVYNCLTPEQSRIYAAILDGTVSEVLIELALHDYVRVNSNVSERIVDEFLKAKKTKILSRWSRAKRKSMYVDLEFDETEFEKQIESEEEEEFVPQAPESDINEAEVEEVDIEEVNDDSSTNTEDGNVSGFMSTFEAQPNNKKDQRASAIIDAYKMTVDQLEETLDFDQISDVAEKPSLSAEFKNALLSNLEGFFSEQRSLTSFTNSVKNCNTSAHKPFSPLNKLPEKNQIINALKSWAQQNDPGKVMVGKLSLDQAYENIQLQIKKKKTHNLLMQLRLVCDSPYLFYFPWSDDKDIDSRLVETSGKMQMLQQLLASLRGHKVLIFSQFTKMLNLLDEWFEATGVSVCRIDGSTKQTHREAEIKRFNNDRSVQVFLLSTRAGGLGINLVAADTVILFDSDWNPQVDLQAMDRVHRLGQTKPVIIYRFATINTAEQVLLSRADSKRKLEKVVIRMGKFESLMRWASQKDPQGDIAQDLARMFRETKFAGSDISDNILTTEELEVLTNREKEAYVEPADNMNHFELFYSESKF